MERPFDLPAATLESQWPSRMELGGRREMGHQDGLPGGQRVTGALTHVDRRRSRALPSTPSIPTVQRWTRTGGFPPGIRRKSKIGCSKGSNCWKCSQALLTVQGQDPAGFVSGCAARCCSRSCSLCRNAHACAGVQMWNPSNSSLIAPSRWSSPLSFPAPSIVRNASAP